MLLQPLTLVQCFVEIAYYYGPEYCFTALVKLHFITALNVGALLCRNCLLLHP
jgi:hypothetical protein